MAAMILELRCNPWSPEETVTLMLESWRRNGQISEFYHRCASEVIEATKMYPTDMAIDCALLRAMMRLDREGIQIRENMWNIHIGPAKLLEFCEEYDSRHSGPLMVVKDTHKLKTLKLEEVDMICTCIMVFTSALYGFRMMKRRESNILLHSIDKKEHLLKGRCWLQEEARHFLKQNRQLSNNAYDDKIGFYLQKPVVRRNARRKIAVW